MAKRYCGEIVLTIDLTDQDIYKVRYTSHRKLLHTEEIHPPKFFAYSLDSSNAFDKIAHAAMSFAPDHVQGQGEYSDSPHWHIRRYKCDTRSRGSR